MHDLVLANPADPFARFFATTASARLPAAQAWPEFARFRRERRTDMLDVLATTTVQTNVADRSATLILPLAWVADRIGEPLHLGEIGCSAGVLLTCDRYAYAFCDRPRFGREDASQVFEGEVARDPPLPAPRIARRTGLDCHPIDASHAEQRRRLIARIFPGFRTRREQLAVALDVVARTDTG